MSRRIIIKCILACRYIFRMWSVGYSTNLSGRRVWNIPRLPVLRLSNFESPRISNYGGNSYGTIRIAIALHRRQLASRAELAYTKLAPEQQSRDVYVQWEHEGLLFRVGSGSRLSQLCRSGKYPQPIAMHARQPPQSMSARRKTQPGNGLAVKYYRDIHP